MDSTKPAPSASSGGKMIDAPAYGKGAMREVREGYATSEDMPGAVLIPSNAGRTGTQYHQDPHELIPIVCDPGDDEFIIDPAKISRAAAEKAAQADTLLERHQQLAAGQCDAPIAAPGAEPTANQDPGRHRPPPKPRPQGTPGPVPVAQQQSPGEAPVQGVGIETTSGAAPLSTEEVTSESQGETEIPGLKARLALLETLAAQGKVMPEPAAETAKELLPAAEPPVEAPTVAVSITIPNYGEVASEYHNVVQHDMALILIYDSRYQHGTRYRPEANQKTPYTLKVATKGEVGEQYTAYYTGINFSYEYKEFMVFLVENPTTE